MTNEFFYILTIIIALCIAGAAYAKGQAKGWTEGFAACSDIWKEVVGIDDDKSDEILNTKEFD